jgi:hypothetical protein
MPTAFTVSHLSVNQQNPGLCCRGHSGEVCRVVLLKGISVAIALAALTHKTPDYVAGVTPKGLPGLFLGS